LRIINSLVGKRLDAQCVAALNTIFDRGDIRIQRVVQAAAAAAATVPAAVPAAGPASVSSDSAGGLDTMRV